MSGERLPPGATPSAPIGAPEPTSGVGEAGLPVPEVVSERPLVETIRPTITGVSEILTDVAAFEDPNESTRPRILRSELGLDASGPHFPHVALGETLQLVRYARRGDTLLINGITPHGRRLTFEQREDRQGWYVVAAGRRRRPTQRELGLVVATITQELEAALVPERQAEVRSAYRLAVASDQPGMPVPGLEAYRDVLLDEAAAYTGGQTERLAVIAVEYQAFKRFAIRHGHRVAAAFVQALGERLAQLLGGRKKLQVFHKSGKAFRIIAVDHTSAELDAVVEEIVRRDTVDWIIQRVWGEQSRTHPDEVTFHIGIATAYPSERQADYAALAQRLSDDAHRAGKLGQIQGHTSLAIAKSDYRTTIYRWNIASEDELNELAADMDDGPAEVMAEMSDFLHELVQADLDGMAVAGDLDALMYCAIARDGFWQGTTAMRISGEVLLRRFMGLETADPEDEENDFVAGFDLGDEFYGIAIEGGRLHFARGDINSAGATRVRAGLEAVQHAVGWRRTDGGGVVGRFVGALEAGEAAGPLVERIRRAAAVAFEENEDDGRMFVNDAVDVAEFLYTMEGKQVTGEDLVEGAVLSLILPRDEPRRLEILSRRSSFSMKLAIDGQELPAAVSDSISGPQVKLRIRKTVASAAVAVVVLDRDELDGLLAEVREDNGLADDDQLDVIGFLRHITDILLEYHVKAPAKIRMAIGARYTPDEFVQPYSLEDVRERHPGLFYEAVHHDLLRPQAMGIDRQLARLVAQTMLGSARPARSR